MNWYCKFSALVCFLLSLALPIDGLSRDSTSVTQYEKVTILTNYKRLKSKAGSGVMFMNAKLFSFDERVSEFYGECENLVTGEKIICFYNTQIQLNNSKTQQVDMGDKTMFRRQLVNAYRVPEGRYRINKITIRKAVGTRQRGRYTDTVSSHQDVDISHFGLTFDIQSGEATYLGRLIINVEPDAFYIDSLTKLEARDTLRKDLALISKPKLRATLATLFDGERSVFSLRNVNVQQSVPGPQTWAKVELNTLGATKSCDDDKRRVMRKSSVAIEDGVFRMNLTNDGFPVFSSDLFTEKMQCALREHMSEHGFNEFRQKSKINVTRKQGARGKIIPTSYWFEIEFRSVGQ
ncbi:hypothetical protein NBRC116583_37030 [Arenicella sp. 4NH20-0111]|uniref:hypothetical protein n=1 Tax=Arenicella sp. 4NH20-0111 TaxID=3127648 RepID=UPI0031079C53